jgi:GTPase
MRPPVIAIVGRPNVGKSTLFNRLARKNLSIVHDRPGVTRDRLYAHCEFELEDESLGMATLIDTGGLGSAQDEPLYALIRSQTELAIQEADVIIHVVDARAGLVAEDRDISAWLRKSGRPTLLAANKLDVPQLDELTHQLHGFGMDVIAVSAEHNRGTGALLEQVRGHLSAALLEGAALAWKEAHQEEEQQNEDAWDHALDDAEGLADGVAGPEDDDTPVSVGEQILLPSVLRLCVVGRPNAGKSSFVNRLLGEDRHLVSDIAGTTVDAIDSFLAFGGNNYRLIDTAGIRRKRSIEERYESLAVMAALRGMDRCDIVLHLIDATAGVTEQDMRIMGFAEEKGKALVIVVNKWDLAGENNLTAEEYTKKIRHDVPSMDHVPIRFVSAKTGRRVHEVLETAQMLAQQHFKRVTTSACNRILFRAADGHQPPSYRGHRIKLLFATQVRVAPATFVIATNDPDGVHFSYRRYLVTQFREGLGFAGVPVRFVFRRRDSHSGRGRGVATKRK